MGGAAALFAHQLAERVPASLPNPFQRKLLQDVICVTYPYGADSRSHCLDEGWRAAVVFVVLSCGCLWAAALMVLRLGYQLAMREMWLRVPRGEPSGGSLSWMPRSKRSER